ncbi:gamma-glutamylcyclotransferase [Dongia deserti]|uniref:gamma-glutamylcyclotransferase n=1 Tax=Dongia deserti TaxID=2268030 RepID=UPI0025487982|nr:gamma-glutamylcyclotransferase [Dongia deserti]
MKDDPGAHKQLTEEELSAWLDRILLEHDEGDLWLFGYGSLMWKPDLDFAESRPALLKGWHRRFCLWQWRWRGSRHHPGLMLALDRGGACRGVAYRIAAPRVREKVAKVWEREMGGNGYRPRWVNLTTMQGALRGLTFVVNHEGGRYAGRISDEIAADHIASACGEAGTSAEYLLETVLRCEELGIHDPFLWRLQELVAERMRTVDETR